MSSKLHVAGLNWQTSDERLGAVFAARGTVTDARVMRDRRTGRSRGYGYVTFSTPEEALGALEALHETTLDGWTIRVEEAR